MNNTSQKASWLKTSVTARMLMIGFLILVLMIPMVFIKDLITERTQRQRLVINEINDKWGKELLIAGPVLKIPYLEFTEVEKYDNETKRSIKEKRAKTLYAYFFPDDLTISSNIDAFKKEYGIYEAAVFSSNMTFTGNFSIPDFQIKDISPENILWEKATFIIQTSNLKGIKENVEILINENKYSFIPRYKNHGGDTPYAQILFLNELESTRLLKADLPINKATNFRFNLKTNGSEKVQFIPIGKKTRVSMKSNWEHPSFQGNFLPENTSETQNSKSSKGFNASWNVLQINRQFEQSFFGSLPNLSEFAFGVKLFLPVDHYQKSERSAKYGYLVISLTFLIFFLIQLISKISIHPFQYLMVGLALVMFYTLLVSISEHQSFLQAYLYSGSAVVLLISLYSISILKNYKFPLFIFCSLTALYTFIYVIISLENYALLVGSIGLFVILALVMFFSRKIEWQ